MTSQSKNKKQNKGNAKRGVSPRLKIRPCDLALWSWKSIGFQILLRTKYVTDGRKEVLLYPFVTSLARG